MLEIKQIDSRLSKKASEDNEPILLRKDEQAMSCHSSMSGKSK